MRPGCHASTSTPCRPGRRGPPPPPASETRSAARLDLPPGDRLNGGQVTRTRGRFALDPQALPRCQVRESKAGNLESADLDRGRLALKVAGEDRLDCGLQVRAICYFFTFAARRFFWWEGCVAKRSPEAAAPVDGRFVTAPSLVAYIDTYSPRLTGRWDSNQNLTMQMRRFTRLTNALSKKLANLKAALALHFAYYNFCRIHSSIRVTPAMEAGISDHVLTLRELLV